MRIVALALLIVAMPVDAHPQHDAIPPVFHVVYGRTAASCNDAEEIALLNVTAGHLAYYEAGEYLVIGVAFESSNGPSLNGRFVVRGETMILPDANLRLVLETPNRLVRYQLAGDTGEPAPGTGRDIWIRCPRGRPDGTCPIV